MNEDLILKELLNNYFKKIKIPWDDKCWDCKEKKVFKINYLILMIIL